MAKRSAPLRDEPNEVTYAAMASAESGEDMYGPFGCAADLLAALDAQDVAAAEVFCYSTTQ